MRKAATGVSEKWFLTGVSENGSNCLSSLRMKSGFSRYPQLPLYSNLPCVIIMMMIKIMMMRMLIVLLLKMKMKIVDMTWFSCIGRSGVWKLRDTSWKFESMKGWKLRSWRTQAESMKVWKDESLKVEGQKLKVWKYEKMKAREFNDTSWK